MFRFEPYVKNIKQVVQYFSDYNLKDKDDNFFVNIKVGSIAKGFPVNSIDYDPTIKHIYGDGVNVLKALRVITSKDSNIYIDLNSKKLLFNDDYINQYTIPIALLFTDIELLKWQRSQTDMPQHVADNIDNIYNMLNTYKVVVNEVYKQ